MIESRPLKLYYFFEAYVSWGFAIYRDCLYLRTETANTREEVSLKH